MLPTSSLGSVPSTAMLNNVRDKKLSTIHSALLGCPIHGAHRALADAVAARRVWVRLVNNHFGVAGGFRMPCNSIPLLSDPILNKYNPRMLDGTPQVLLPTPQLGLMLTFSLVVLAHLFSILRAQTVPSYETPCAEVFSQRK